MAQVYDAAVIGGGAFGCAIAAWLRRRRDRVVLLEERGDLCQRASYANQARVHNGYHYPRHLPTAARSAVGFRRFVAEFADCVDRSFTKVYAIARQFSKVRADYFAAVCRQIGSPCRAAGEAVTRLFDREAVEAVFEVEEFAFDAVRLKQRLRRELAGVELRLNTTVRRVTAGGAARVRLDCGVEADDVFNCTYSGLNRVLLASDLPPLPLKHELAELAIVEVPAALKRLGVTVMCGPFFSCMPFPALGLHSLSHVRYTPHAQWADTAVAGGMPALSRGQGAVPETRTNFGWMVRDAARYLPPLAQCQYRRSLFEVKTVLAASEGNDGRPILFRRDHGLPGLHCVLGGKIDNIFDMTDELEGMLAGRAAA
jgi:glycine/D-amino acid oxidase-like deaminating enzyme